MHTKRFWVVDERGGRHRFIVDRVLDFLTACIRAKSVGRLPQEFHLTLFPHRKTANVQGSFAQL